MGTRFRHAGLGSVFSKEVEERWVLRLRRLDNIVIDRRGCDDPPLPSWSDN